MGEPIRKSAAPVAKAKTCLACRSKHVRCDGADPCSYCVERQMSCVYVASRRGFYPRRTQHQNQQQQQQQQQHHHHHQEPSERAASAPTATSASTTPASGAGADPAYVSKPTSSPSSASGAPSTPSPTLASFEGYANALASTNTNTNTNTAAAPRHHHHHPLPAAAFRPSSDAALDAYYHYCFPAHPFVLPRAHFSHQKVASAPAGHALLAAMRWAGSLFVRAASPAARESLFSKARDAVAHELTPRNGYLAQAMLVMVIAMDGVCDRAASAELLGRLEALALEVGLHRRDFAAAAGAHDAVSAESWRRTWWELYVVDAMVAGVHRTTSFPLHGVESDVGLPCEEDAYLRGDIPISPPPRLLSQLQDEAFSADDGYEFSSFAYRVQCACAMGHFTTQQRQRQHQYDGGESLRRAEATLTNWKLHLPERKRAALGRGGQHDEMMFQALMMHHAMSIMLHQPLSHLDTSAAEPIDACAAPEHTRSQAQGSPALLMMSPSSSSSSPYSPSCFVPSSDAACDAHAARAVAAATAISDLVTHREAMLRHSHFFACVVTLSSVVHFSRWALATEFFAQPAAACAADDDDVRQCIKLNIGALRALAQVWPAASNACLQVQSVARELHNLSSRVAPAALLPGDTLEVNLAQALAVDDTLWQMWNSLG